MIRKAVVGDIAEIARLGAIFHAQAGWSEIDYHEADCAASLTQFVQSPAFICLVADQGGVVGMASGVISPVYFNRDHVSGEELFWWVSPQAPQMTGIRLLKALEGEAKAQGCSTWQMKSLDRLGGDRMEALYRRCGYRASERSFIKEL